MQGKKMKRIIAIIGFLLIQIPSFACLCGISSLDEEINDADFIFSGTPISKEKRGAKLIYRFQIDKVLKGQPKDDIIIQTGLGGPDCGFVFDLNNRYIVFSKDGRTNRCRRTAQYNLSPDMYELGQRFKGIDISKEQFKARYFEGHFKELKNQEIDFDEKNPLLLLHGLKISFDELLNELGNHGMSNIWYFPVSKDEKDDLGDCVEDGIIYVEGFFPSRLNISREKLLSDLKKIKPCI